MKPTNYHLFDFMDFDLELKKNESLWKAYKPTAVVEKAGDILPETGVGKRYGSRHQCGARNTYVDNQTV